VKRGLATSLVLALTLAGCRAAAPLPRLVDPDLQVGSMAHRTDFELGPEEEDTPSMAGDARAEEGPPSPEETLEPPVPTDSVPADEEEPGRRSRLRAFSSDELTTGDADKLDDDKDQRRRTALFWSGVAILAVFAGTTAGMMATGQIVENRLNDGYDAALSRDREQRLRDTGKVTNQVAIVTGGISLLGLALLLAGYGLDYSVCGKMAKRRKKCRNR
jgi:hypothetical protein